MYSSCALAAGARQSLYVPVKDFIFLLNIKSRLVHLRPSQPAGRREQTSYVWPPPLLQSRDGDFYNPSQAQRRRSEEDEANSNTSSPLITVQDVVNDSKENQHETSTWKTRFAVTQGETISRQAEKKKKAQNSSICVTLICECESRSAAGTSALPTGSRQRGREKERRKKPTCGNHQGILAHRHAAGSAVMLNVL